MAAAATTFRSDGMLRRSTSAKNGSRIYGLTTLEIDNNTGVMTDQVLELGVDVERLLDVAQEARSDDAPTSPHLCMQTIV
jgi:hypothetical protein